MKNIALKLLGIVLDGEPEHDVAALVSYQACARDEVDSAGCHAEEAVGLLAASPGPAGMEARVARFKEIVAALKTQNSVYATRGFQTV